VRPSPDDLPTIPGPSGGKGNRNIFIYMTAGGKVRTPAAAMALIERLR
jgi:hypothetical protein